ncbi:hypothetical protein E1B28_006316 [Marasmius oreades]|uniref:T6SS Phospholipase effector Tle1-like catalytic domain-containing protein n=1 Tax=Marasmius oreades TaxID=181124 RepID=A0A9P7UVP0_9AGAR|nr:uncharacterized protein E1B28_006316 [Marasmius oreades]KAG7095585.1 hypothetical protein E1B28_006316 [Marasmius oreades]
MPDHFRESTLISLTDTVTHDHDDDLQPPSPDSATVLSHDRVRRMTDPPTSLPTYGKPLPVRRKETLDPRIVPPIIPPEHSHRTLVLCFDGTGDQFDCDNSNIVQFVSLLKKDDCSKQMVYYQSGIGTYTSPTIATPLLSTITKTLDQAVALNLDAHVMDGYEFLMQNYMDGDRISILGFSRGAYTARSLAGMIHKVGLLPAGNWQQVPFAYKMYTRTDQLGWEQSNAFKKAFSVNVTIDFVGVWDTVDSVGLIPKRLPFTVSNTIIRTFRHAVSLDERRAKFKANLWNQPNNKDKRMEAASRCAVGDTPPEPTDSKKQETKRKSVGHVEQPSFHWLDEEEEELADFEGQFSARIEDKPTDVEEVWFAGCHSDVGGGSVNNSTRHSLARISLRWMIRECFKANTGIMFDSRQLRKVGLDPTTLYPFVTPRPSPLPSTTLRVLSASGGEKKHWLKRLFSKRPVATTEEDQDYPVEKPGPLTEEEEDLWDAMAPIYDQLKWNPIWWILELIPMTFCYQRDDDKWGTWFGMNLAHPRAIPKHKTNGIKVHRSVQLRMKASEGKKYVPKARFSHEHATWID